MRPSLPGITPPSGFSFSDEDVAKRRTARRRLVHTRQIPMFRLAGMVLLALVTWAFSLAGTSASGDDMLLAPTTITWILLLYWAMSWWSLRLWYDPERTFDLSFFWLLADYLPLLLFLYAIDGIDQWIALLLALRFSDQAEEGPARTLLFVCASIFLYLGAAALVDRLLMPVDFDRVLLISAVLIACGAYATLRSSSSRYLRERTRTAVRAARALVRRLEDRGKLLERQAQELSEERARAEQASRSKNHFLANVSHEIRTPLNGLIGMIDILYDSQLDDQQVRHLTTLRKSANSLLSLLNDILDLTKIEAGKLHTEQIDFSLRDLVHDVVAISGSSGRRRELVVSARIEDDVPDRVVGDPARLRQILTNLLSNALKFTEDGTIEVAVLHATAQSTDSAASHTRLRFEVRDSGIGIAPEKLDEVFEAFVQADESTTRRFGGTGLGLPICRQLVLLMDGEMGAESEPGEGSTFWFELPFLLSRKAPTRDSTGSLSLRARRALLLGARDGEALERRFRPWGLSFRQARSGAEARERIAEALAKGRPFEVLLVLLNGDDLVADAWHQLADQLPVMLLSETTPSPEELREAAAAGAAAMLHAQVPDYRIAFALRLLLDSEEDLPMIDDELLDRRSPKYRVLLVEDNRVNQQVALRHLEKGGYDVEIAVNGREAVEQFASSRFDIVLMDLQMPEVDGYEAARQIRELPRGLRVPIVAVTAHALKGDRESVLAAGLDDYLPKPISPTRLYDVIERNLHTSPEAIPSLFRR